MVNAGIPDRNSGYFKYCNMGRNGCMVFFSIMLMGKAVNENTNLKIMGEI